MRFMLLLKSNDEAESGALPDAEIVAAMGKYNEELVKAGVLLDANGLHASSEGFRIQNSGGDLTVTDGPFAETKELIAGYWIIQAKSLEEATEWAKRAPVAEKEGESGQIEVRQVFELEDFPVSENESGWREQEAELRAEWDTNKPAGAGDAPATDAPRKELLYMGMFKSDERTEAGVLPTEEELATMGELMADAAKAGILVSGEGLQPSSKGVRVEFSGGKRTVIDGPFAETKELVAGFALLAHESKEEALEWAKRAAIAGGDGVSELRRVFTASEFPEELVIQLPEDQQRAFKERTGTR